MDKSAERPEVENTTLAINKDSIHEVAAVTGVATVAGIGGAVMVTAAATKALAMIGFTKTGVLLGSAAATYQSGIGTVDAESWFAILQSVGATGGSPILCPIGISAGLLVGTGARYRYYCRRRSQSKTVSIHDMDATRSADTPDKQEATTATNEGTIYEVAAATGVATGAGIGGAVTATTTATAYLNMIGFTKAGIAAGSLAAAMQSAIGAVTAGSPFAILQSVGATGGSPILCPIGISAGLLAAAMQSAIGAVTAGSPFAILQSVGATGGFAIFGPIGISAGVITVGVTYWWHRRGQRV